MSDLALRACTDRGEWDSLLAASAQQNAFCYDDFLSAMPHPPVRWLLERKNKPVAGAVVFAEGNRSLPAPRPLTTYQGIFLLPPRADIHSRIRWEIETIEKLIIELSAHYDSLSFSLHPSLSDIRAFQWFNYHAPGQNRFTIEVAYTGIVDLSQLADFGAFLDTVRAARREDVKKAAKANIDAIVSDDVGAFDRLHEATFARQGMTRSSDERAFIGSALAPLLHSGRCRMLMAVPRAGDPVAATIFLHDKTTAYYYFGACDPAWRSSGVSTFLIVESIKHAWRMGLRAIDMVGINSPERGDFKVSFNAGPRAYFNVHWNRC